MELAGLYLQNRFWRNGNTLSIFKYLRLSNKVLMKKKTKLQSYAETNRNVFLYYFYFYGAKYYQFGVFKAFKITSTSIDLFFFQFFKNLFSGQLINIVDTVSSTEI